jgi:hypothetical protein
VDTSVIYSQSIGSGTRYSDGVINYCCAAIRLSGSSDYDRVLQNDFFESGGELHFVGLETGLVVVSQNRVFEGEGTQIFGQNTGFVVSVTGEIGDGGLDCRVNETVLLVFTEIFSICIFSQILLDGEAGPLSRG